MQASRTATGLVGAALQVLLLTVPANGQETTRVSVDSSGAEGNGNSGYIRVIAISADGQIVAFDSLASNLVAGDTNGVTDVFVYDRSTGITERVSVDSSGAEGGNFSFDPSISADGQIVAFGSYNPFVTGDTNHTTDRIPAERLMGTTRMPSRIPKHTIHKINRGLQKKRTRT